MSAGAPVEVERPLRLHEADPFTFLFWWLRRERYRRGSVEDGGWIRSETAPPLRLESLPTLAELLGPPVTLPLRHFEGPDARGPLGPKTTYGSRLLAAIPTLDRHDSFDDVAEARAFVARTFPYLRASPWTETLSDAALTALVTRGLGAHLLRRDATGGFRLDLEDLERYEVRPGFERYGASLRLDEDLRPTSIERHGETFHPGQRGWEKATLAFQATLAVRATLVDHSLGTHFIYAGAFNVALRLLPADHPLRRALMPFVYGTTRINQAATLTLLCDGGYFPRLFALTWGSICRLQASSAPTLGWESFPARLERQGLDPEDARLAFASEGFAWWETLERFAAEICRRWGEEAEARILVEALTQLVPHAAPPADRPGEALRRLLPAVLFQILVMHRHVGHLGSYVCDPAWMPVKIRPGEARLTRLARQDTIQKIVLAMVVTQHRMPRVLDDVSHLFPDEGTRAVWTGFQAELRSLSTTLAARAVRVPATRPDGMEISVSL